MDQGWRHGFLTLAVVVSASLGLLSTACSDAPGGAQEQAVAPIPVLVDTDMGFDDVRAHNDAVDLLIETITGAPEPMTVLTLGPLTNLAEALEVAPEVSSDIERLVVMGGAFDVGGNTLGFRELAVAEFNIWFDPVAADQVFAADIDTTLVPLDATNDVPVTPALYAAFSSLGSDAPASARLLKGHLEARPFTGGSYHWDDLAAATITAPELVDIETRRVTVVTAAGPANGQTVVDSNGREMSVAVRADRLAFERHLAQGFGLDDLDTSTYVADATVMFDGSTCRYQGPDPMPESLTIEITNTSDRSALGVSAGVYDPGTTRSQLEAYWASNPTTPPWFLTMHAIAPLPAATRSYWHFDNPEGTTLSCAYDLTSGVELAGPRLGP